MRILVIEDDKELSDIIIKQLKQNGYHADQCLNGGDALFYCTEEIYDLIILDRMLPELDGLSLLSIIRRRGLHTPVIMATALDGLGERIDGLDAGADDYIVKPFAIEELLARIRAITRRPGRFENSRELNFSDLALNEATHELKSGSQTVSLSKKEAALLQYLIKNAGQTLTRTQILSYIWGPDSEVEEGNLDNYIYFLRRRLKSVGSKAAIKTIHSVGYRLEQNHD